MRLKDLATHADLHVCPKIGEDRFGYLKEITFSNELPVKPPSFRPQNLSLAARDRPGGDDSDLRHWPARTLLRLSMFSMLQSHDDSSHRSQLRDIVR